MSLRTGADHLLRCGDAKDGESEIVKFDTGRCQDFVSGTFWNCAMMIGNHCALFRNRMPQNVVRSGDVVNKKSGTLENFYKFLRRDRAQFTHEEKIGQTARASGVGWLRYQ